MHTETASPRFVRKIEDFVCGQCGHKVQGSGYTNHCPRCLFSRHVDVNPGDRGATCGALMRPVSVEPWGESWKILHRCIACGHERKNKTAPDDDFDAVLALAKKQAKTKTGYAVEEDGATRSRGRHSGP